MEIDDEQFEVIENMDEEGRDDVFKEVTVPSPVHENDDISKQLPSDSSLCKHDYSVQAKTEDGEDDFKEVIRHSAAQDQMYGQLIADSSYYQSDYSAHFVTGSQMLRAVTPPLITGPPRCGSLVMSSCLSRQFNVKNAEGMWWKNCCTVCMFCSRQRMQVELLNGRSVGLRTWLSERARDKEHKDVTELLLFLFL